MKNGTEIQAFIESTAQLLAGLRVTDYYAEPLPSPTDLRLANVVGRFMAITPSQRETFQAALTQSQRALFGIYGHRAATLGRREESRERLLSGLAAAAIANYEIPARRNVEVALSVYHHVARKLGLNTVDLFDEAAGYAVGETAVLLRQFGRRRDVTLHKFGWREIKTPDGVKYKFSLGG